MGLGSGKVAIVFYCGGGLLRAYTVRCVLCDGWRLSRFCVKLPTAGPGLREMLLLLLLLLICVLLYSLLPHCGHRPLSFLSYLQAALSTCVPLPAWSCCT